MADSSVTRIPRTRASKCAHIIERVGLAMAGASCGLFVAAHVANSRVEAFGSVALVFILMILGAVGFYLGIDVPPHRSGRLPLTHASNPADAAPPFTDPVELLSAAGTFLAATAAFASVYIIVFDVDTSTTTTMILAGFWLLGATMQIVAGMSARMRRTG